MSKPTINQTVGGFEFLWAEGITIKVNHLHVHNSDGRVTGELLIKHGTDVLSPPTQLNFSSDRTRNTLIKSLTERYSTYDWQGIVDQLCYHIQEKAREGEPLFELDTTLEIKPPNYLVYPLIIANQPNILFGEPESGKTQFAMLLCVIMMLPWKDNPLSLTAPNKSHNPLWLDYEADRDTTHWNFKRIVKGIDVGDLWLPYRRCRLPLADDVEQIANHMEKAKANCIVIDSLAKAVGGDLDKSESPTRFFSAVDQLKCTTIILAHTSKERGKNKTVYGSTFFEAYARSIWELRASHDETETMHVGLWDNKANFRGKLPPMAFSFNYDDEHIFVGVEDIKTVDDFIHHLSVSSMILEILKDGSKKVAEIKDALSDVSSSSIYVELARLSKKNKVTKIRVGKEIKYGLSYQGDLSPEGNI